MQQYFENRVLSSFKEVKKNNGKKHENIIIANERIDENWNSNNYVINNSTFAKVGFLKSKFSNDDLRL